MNKKEIVENCLRERGSVFEALELAVARVYTAKIQAAADTLRGLSFKEAVVKGMELVEHDTENKKEFLLNILKELFQDVEWGVVGDMVDVVVSATKGQIGINVQKERGFCGLIGRTSR